LLIVVDQMLTGFDSKWLNTLYMDKVLHYENIIQAFSRTNRLFGEREKPFGTIRYYRKPHTMEQNINKAVKLYSDDKVMGLFVEQLEYNLNKLNSTYGDIVELFRRAKVLNLEKLPDDNSERGKFAKFFKEFNDYLEASKIQGFKWKHSKYEFSNAKGKSKSVIEMKFDEKTYQVLALRYQELFNGGGAAGGPEEIPFEIDPYLTAIDTGRIDADYMNSRFKKYLKTMTQEGVDEENIQQTLDDVHQSFAMLTQEEQKFANIFLHDVQSGNVTIVGDKTFRDYIAEYQFKAEDAEIDRISHLFGLDEEKLRKMMNASINPSNINEFGRFDDLKGTVDKNKAKAYFEKLEGKQVPLSKVNMKVYDLLQKFIISGGFEIQDV